MPTSRRTAVDVQSDIAALRAFSAEYRRYLAIVGLMSQSRHQGDAAQAQEIRSRLWHLVPAAGRAMEHSGVRLTIAPPPMVGGPVLTDFTSQVFAHERPPFQPMFGVSGEVPATAQMVFDGVDAAIAHLADQGIQAGKSSGLRAKAAEYKAPDRARRFTIFGRLKRVPEPLGVMADLITVALFIAAMVGLLLDTGSTHGKEAVSAQTNKSVSKTLVRSGTSTTVFPGQISGGDVNFEIANLTTRRQYANHQTAGPCDVLEYRINLYNPGPGNLVAVRVAADINTVTPHRIFEPFITAYTPGSVQPEVSFEGHLTLTEPRTQRYLPHSATLVDPNGKVLETSAPGGSLSDNLTANNYGIGLGKFPVGTSDYFSFRAQVLCKPAQLPTP